MDPTNAEAPVGQPVDMVTDPRIFLALCQAITLLVALAEARGDDDAVIRLIRAKQGLAQMRRSWLALDVKP